jgi:hypothetical protein
MELLSLNSKRAASNREAVAWPIKYRCADPSTPQPSFFGERLYAVVYPTPVLTSVASGDSALIVTFTHPS